MTDDERAIRDLVGTWMKASEAGDLNTVLSLMADDVIFMAPGREPFGKEEFRAASETMKKVRLTGTSDIRELKVLGYWAWRNGCLLYSREQTSRSATGMTAKCQT